VQREWEQLTGAFAAWAEPTEGGITEPDRDELRHAIGQLSAVVAEWDGRATATAAQEALQGMAKLWAGTGVPQGTRNLAKEFGLTPVAVAQLADQADQTDHTDQADRSSGSSIRFSRFFRAWTNRLLTQLAGAAAPSLDQIQPSMAPEELATLIQAATTGASGPLEFLAQVVPDHAEALAGLGWRTRVDAHRAAILAALRPFEEALNQVTVSDRPALAQLVRWLDLSTARQKVDT